MKKIILISLIGIFTIPLLVFATSEACSWHEGVNCGIGPDEDGSVICNDGWSGSSVNYYEAVQCQIYSDTNIPCSLPISYGCLTEEDLTVIKFIFCQPDEPSSTCETQVANCQEEISDYQGRVTQYQECVSNFIYQYSQDLKKESSRWQEILHQYSMETSCKANSYYDKKTDSCECYDGYIRKGGQCQHGISYCRQHYGPYAAYKTGDWECSCEFMYTFNRDKTECEIISTFESKVLGATYSENNPLSLKPNWLIKNKEFVEVFWVDRDLCLHWVINEQAAVENFGPTWNYEGNIKEFDKIPLGYQFCDYLE